MKEIKKIINVKYMYRIDNTPSWMKRRTNYTRGRRQIEEGGKEPLTPPSSRRGDLKIQAGGDTKEGRRLIPNAQIKARFNQSEDKALW